MRMGRHTVRQLVLSATLCTGLVVGSLLSPQAATAATYYVAAKGNNGNPGTQAQPFQTISKGLSVLNAGDTLYLRAGTYAERIDFSAQTIPSGTSWSNPVTIASAPGETATLAPIGGAYVINLFAPYIQYIIFDRLVIDCANLNHGGSPGTYANYSLSLGGGAHHIRFQNGEMKNGEGPHVTMYSAGDSSFQSFFEVVNSKIHDAKFSYGFYVSTDNNLIDGNEIYNNGGYGIQLYNGYGYRNSNNIFRNNKIYSNGLVRGQGGIVASHGDNTQIYNNLIYYNFRGIEVSLGNPNNTKIYHNTIYGNQNEGVQIFSGVPNTVVRNTILYQNGGDISDNGTGTIISNNLIGTSPNFVNAAGNDFHLQAASPAINAGVAISAVTVDIDKTARPQGTGYDIGAYEYRALLSQLPAPKNFRTTSVAP